jgi:hypothetical protein
MRKATRLLIFVLTVIVTLVSCSVSVRPVYEDQEQALAQIAVEQSMNAITAGTTMVFTQ